MINIKQKKRVELLGSPGQGRRLWSAASRRRFYSLELTYIRKRRRDAALHNLRLPSILILLSLLIFAAISCNRKSRDNKTSITPLRLEVSRDRLSADGEAQCTFTLRGGGADAKARWSVSAPDAPGRQLVRVIEQSGRELIVKAGTAPGRVRVIARAGGTVRSAHITLAADYSDMDMDGFPEVAELKSAGDRERFRSWFTTIARSQFHHASDAWPPEKRDCAGLIRFAFTEALKKHDTKTLSRFKFLERTDIRDVRKYNFPDVPLLNDRVFRTRSGVFNKSDLADGAFAAFVSARLLQEANTHFVSRNVSRAKPGDLIFFLHFAETDMPYHSMIFLGADRPGFAPLLVYHTGPVADGPGRMKLISVDDLMRFPDVRWHPTPDNDNFLGVYRFNILD